MVDNAATIDRREAERRAQDLYRAVAAASGLTARDLRQHDPTRPHVVAWRQATVQVAIRCLDLPAATVAQLYGYAPGAVAKIARGPTVEAEGRAIVRALARVRVRGGGAR